MSYSKISSVNMTVKMGNFSQDDKKQYEYLNILVISSSFHLTSELPHAH